MNSRIVTLVLLAVIGIPVLILLGQWSATEPVLAGACALGLIGIVVLLQLGQKSWLLIPFFSSFTGALVILPGDFAPRDLAVGVAVAQLMLIWSVRRFPVRFRFGLVEVVLLVTLAFVVQAFVRNPTGLSVLGTESVGARPYFEIAVSVAAFLVLSTQVVDLRSIRMLVLALFIGALCAAVYETLTAAIAGVAYYTSRFYRGELTSMAAKSYLGLRDDIDEAGIGRLHYLKYFPPAIMRMLYSYLPPLSVINPFRIGVFLLVLLCVACTLLSGFRGLVATMGLFTIAAAFLHRKGIQLVVLSMVGVPLLAVLLVMQGSVFNLPFAAQRALSFLPADWDYAATSRAESSTEWRYEMWELALTSDKYIRNKWLGDGYGFTAEELAYQQSMEMQKFAHRYRQEHYLLTGTYHSGPVETIKRIGYIGLGALMLCMILVARYAAKMASRSRGTPYFPYAVFIALPMVIYPFLFVFIFGTFQGAVSLMLTTAGMMRMLETSLERWVPEPETAPVEPLHPPLGNRAFSRA